MNNVSIDCTAPLPPMLVERVADASEKEQVRVAACVALQNIGGCEEAVAAVPRLLDVLKNPLQPVFVRERILWSLRVHQVDLLNYDDFFVALKSILVEPDLKTKVSGTGHKSGKMMRYDAAFLLGVLKQAEAPVEVLPVLLEFLHDDTIRIYSGIKGPVSGQPIEPRKNPNQPKVIEFGDADGRIMALKALQRIGYERAKMLPEIITRLRFMRDSADFEPDIRAEAKKILSDWHVK